MLPLKKHNMLTATLKNLTTGETINVTATTDSPDSSYGEQAWVDADGNSYGQIQFVAPIGFALIDSSEPIDTFANTAFFDSLKG